MAEHNDGLIPFSFGDFKLKCRTEPLNSNADISSRLSAPVKPIDEPAMGRATSTTEGTVSLISRDGRDGLYTPLSLINTPAFGVGGGTTAAHASVLGSS